MLAKRIENAFKRKNGPNGLKFQKNACSDISFNESDSEHDSTVNFIIGKNNECGYLSKIQVTLDVFDILNRWHKVITIAEKHISDKRW